MDTLKLNQHRSVFFLPFGIEPRSSILYDSLLFRNRILRERLPAFLKRRKPDILRHLGLDNVAEPAQDLKYFVEHINKYLFTEEFMSADIDEEYILNNDFGHVRTRDIDVSGVFGDLEKVQLVYRDDAQTTVYHFAINRCSLMAFDTSTCYFLLETELRGVRDHDANPAENVVVTLRDWASFNANMRFYGGTISGDRRSVRIKTTTGETTLEAVLEQLMTRGAAGERRWEYRRYGQDPSTSGKETVVQPLLGRMNMTGVFLSDGLADDRVVETFGKSIQRIQLLKLMPFDANFSFTHHYIDSENSRNLFSMYKTSHFSVSDECFMVSGVNDAFNGRFLVHNSIQYYSVFYLMCDYLSRTCAAMQSSLSGIMFSEKRNYLKQVEGITERLFFYRNLFHSREVTGQPYGQFIWRNVSSYMKVDESFDKLSEQLLSISNFYTFRTFRDLASLVIFLVRYVGTRLAVIAGLVGYFQRLLEGVRAGGLDGRGIVVMVGVGLVLLALAYWFLVPKSFKRKLGTMPARSRSR